MASSRGTLQREIKQSKPFRTPAHEATVALLRTTDLVRRHFAAVFAAYGITLAQYNVLRILRGAGDEGLPTSDVGERLIEHAPGVTRMMDRLETKGWVRRERCTEDRRVVFCHITSNGLQLLAHMDEAVDRADADAVRGLSETEQKRLARLLDKVRTPLLRDGV